MPLRDPGTETVVQVSEGGASRRVAEFDPPNALESLPLAGGSRYIFESEPRPAKRNGGSVMPVEEARLWIPRGNSVPSTR